MCISFCAGQPPLQATVDVGDDKVLSSTEVPLQRRVERNPLLGRVVVMEQECSKCQVEGVLKYQMG